ncbi:MAG: sulfite exporter TauE/SafE family protein [Myxococcales bacterium]|nr:sulfite exporter TauE/SafE family protein [Myxococcales bacterium]
MTLPPAYAQVLGLGVLWTSIHCIGMCGPLLSGLDIAGVMRGRSRLQGLLGVVAYQAGRGLTYAWLGGLAGLLGAGLGRLATISGALLALSVGLLLIHRTLRALRPEQQQAAGTPLIPLRRPRLSLSPAVVVEQVLLHSRRALLPLLTSHHPLRELALGALLGMLPCMIPAWALSQAAMTGSPLHGALVMLLLVGMTTPVLLLATQLPTILGVLPASIHRRLIMLLPAVSGVWLILVGGAGLGLWSHAHLGITLAGRPFLMMLW